MTVTVRDEIDVTAARPILRRLAEVEWDSLHLPAQLAAITVGDEGTRGEAWWNLWSDIRHDGTLAEENLPAVPVLLALGEWRDYPDRPQAIVLLREIARADGVATAQGQPAHGQFAQLREALATGTRHVATRWRSEPPEVRRALVWLMSTVPEVRVHYHALIDETLPDQQRAAWEAELVGQGDPRALEEWVSGG